MTACFYNKPGKFPNITNEWEANWLSRATFTYMNSIISYGWHNQIFEKDIGDLLDYDKSTVIVEQFWRKQIKNDGGGEYPANNYQRANYFKGRKSYKKELIISGICKLIGDALSLAGPLFLGLLLKYLESDSRETYGGISLGYWYAIGIFACSLIQNWCLQWHHHKVIRIGIHFRSLLRALIFEKCLRIQPGQLDRGKEKIQVATLQSVDVEMIMLVPYFIHYLWAAPLLTCVLLYLLIREIGLAALAGFAILVLFIPAQWKLGIFFRKISKKTFAFTDLRVKVIKEMINGIKLVKVNVMEGYFKDVITDARKLELHKKRTVALVDGLNSSLTHASPIIVAMITFVAYANISDEELTAQTAFTTIALLSLLRLPLFIFPMLVKTMGTGFASSNRVLQLLNLSEIEEYRQILSDQDAQLDNDSSPAAHDGGNAVVFADAAFSWIGDQNNFVLAEVSTRIPKNRLTVISGPVGSGKTALICSLLGTMCLKKGSIRMIDIHSKPLVIKAKTESAQECHYRTGGRNAVVHSSYSSGYCAFAGGIAYCSQTPFILNNTVKENILFGSKYEKMRYNLVVWACCLEQDLEQLPQGDKTQIGERGVNLSGGQKARISLARAIYRKDPAMYIFDDVFSALDVHVSKKIFERCVKTLIRNQTCIIASHDLEFAKNADLVLEIVPLRSSEVTSTVRSRNVVQEAEDTDVLGVTVRSDIAAAIEAYHSSNSNNIHVDAISILDADIEGESTDDEEEGKDDSGNIAESREVGTVRGEIYSRYLWALTSPIFASITVSQILVQVGTTGTDFWLAYWSSEDGSRSPTYFAGVYSALSCATILCVLMLNLLWAVGSIVAARKLHQSMLVHVVHATMSFFEKTPAGRIINRFANDTNEMDAILPSRFKEFFNLATRILAVLIVQAIVLPYILIGYIPLTLLYLFILERYRRTYREVNRVDNVTKSPIYSILGEAVVGSETIRAYDDYTRFYRINTRRNDTNTQSHFKKNTLNRWLGLRLDWLGAVITFLVVILVVALRTNAGEAGVVVTYALVITNLLNWLVRNATDTEAAMNAIERIFEFSSRLPQENAMIIEDNRPRTSWPERGEIIFNNVEMRYRPELPLTLKKVNFTIPGGSHVGVCGRTGSGKSSLIISLFRLVEIENNGSILIDKVDVAKIGLADLRSALALVPQDPLLFAGTLRSNLDQQNQYSDEQIWNALERVQMAGKVKAYTHNPSREESANNSKKGDVKIDVASEINPEVERKGEISNPLQVEVMQGGANYSSGERQLLCFVRVLLRSRNVKVLCLDEASSSIDNQSDENLHTVIRENFEDATMITVAHRINTIRSSDLILVMENGYVEEFDKPEELLKNPDSSFSKLVKAASLKS